MHMRYILEPGGVERKLGPQAAARREWREDKARCDTKAGKSMIISPLPSVP